MGLVRQLSEVHDIEVSSRLFGQVQLHRNNTFYDFLMKVCELVHRNLLISETPGRSTFSDFTRDEEADGCPLRGIREELLPIA